MRSVVILLATCSLLGCSSPAPQRAQEIGCATCSSYEPASAPVITFVLVPSSIAASADGRYDLGFVISYTDDTDDGAHSVRIETDSFTLDTPLPIQAPNSIVSASVPLPADTSKGTLDFTLRVVSPSGGVSKPYTDSIFLL